MNRKDILLEFKRLQDRNMKTVRDKNKIYGAEEDAFQAFKDAVDYGSKIETQPQALWNMMSKHLVTVKRWVDEGIVPNENEVAEKLGDIAIYMSLLELMWMEALKGKCLGRITVGGVFKSPDAGTSYSEKKVRGDNPASYLLDRAEYDDSAAEDTPVVYCASCDHAQDGDICGLTGSSAAAARNAKGSCGPEGRNFKAKQVHMCNGCCHLAPNGNCRNPRITRMLPEDVRRNENFCGAGAKWYKPVLGKSLDQKTKVGPTEANGINCRTCGFCEIKGYFICRRHEDLAAEVRSDTSRCGPEGADWEVASV